MNGSDLREGLLGAETASAELERRYREAILGLVERRLGPAQRAVHVFGLLMSLGLVAFFLRAGWGLLAHPTATAIAGVAIGLAFSVGWGALALATLARGAEDVRLHAAMRAWLIVGFVFLLMGLMLWAGMTDQDVVHGIRTVLYGIAFFVGLGIPYLVAQQVGQAELRVREDVLRLRLTVAQLAERLEPRRE